MNRINNAKRKNILIRMQANFPIVSTPYLPLAKELNLPAQEILEALKRFKKDKIIRRFGAVFVSKKLGFKSTLVGVKVNRRNQDIIGKRIAHFDQVTHCYARDHIYNLWFTLTCQSQKELNGLLTKIKMIKGIEAVLYLPAIRTFKIRTEFKLD